MQTPTGSEKKAEATSRTSATVPIANLVPAYSESATSDSITNPINYFYITSTSNATSGNIEGGGANCSAGPVTLEVVNG